MKKPHQQVKEMQERFPDISSTYLENFKIQQKARFAEIEALKATYNEIFQDLMIKLDSEN
jgi:hypothetical protein